MPDTSIDQISPSDIDTIAHLYNSLFRPERDRAYLDRRITGRSGVIVLAARHDNDAVGFYVGMELKPDTHISWVCGVSPDARRMGVATQLMEYASDWARTKGYQYHRFECPNTIRPFLSFGIRADFDIVGVRWDPGLHTNLVIFEKAIGDNA